MKNTDDPIVIEQDFDVSIFKLWNTITDIRHMTKWFFENIGAFEPKVGFQTQFVVENEGRIFPHLWKITEVIPHKKISYNWKYEDYPGDSLVTFEIFDRTKGSKLILTHKTIENFPQDIEEFKRESCIEGWHWFIKKNLKQYLLEQQ